MPADPLAGLRLAGYRPGALAGVVRLHMAYYGPAWGFGLPFEAKVAGELADFLRRFDQERDLFLCAYEGADVAASLSIDGARAASAGAHLRWYIVSERLRGLGLGRRLLDRALGFCRERRYSRVYLTTFEGLAAARHLYESVGFRLTAESDEDQWQGRVREQRFELELRRGA